MLFSYAPSQISLSSMGLAIYTGTGVLSMKVEYLQGAPPHLHTQTSYPGTWDNTQQRVYMPATNLVARGLLSSMPVCGWHFSAMGERVKYFNWFRKCYLTIFNLVFQYSTLVEKFLTKEIFSISSAGEKTISGPKHV